MTAIDQIMVRRVGGWVLVTKADWLALGAEKQASLLSQEAVQFVSSGSLVEPEVALPLLDPPLAGAGESAQAGPPVELKAQGRPAVVYRRVVIEGPAYQIQRERRGEVAVFHEHRSRLDDYALDREDGIADLAADLLADSFDIDDEVELSAAALKVFVTSVFEVRLGDRVWSIDSSDLRNHVEDNPHLIVVS